MRAMDLRQAALTVMGKSGVSRRDFSQHQELAPSQFRVLSYNVHGCLGTDNVLSVERVAQVIARACPDIVFLQELDAGLKTLAGNHQAEDIARELEMSFHFHPVCGQEMQCFGNAILSRHPMTLIKAELLPMLAKSRIFEPRGVLWVRMEVAGRTIDVLNTHLSLWGPEQQIQIRKLTGTEILGHPKLGRDMILCGDFNLTPGSRYHRQMLKYFKEPAPGGVSRELPNTWVSRWPVRRLDYIFFKGDLSATSVDFSRTLLESSASDHLPIIADFKWSA